MKSPMGGGQHGMIPGSPGCRSNVSQTSPGSGTLEVAPRSRWDVSSFENDINARLRATQNKEMRLYSYSSEKL